MRKRARLRALVTALIGAAVVAVTLAPTASAQEEQPKIYGRNAPTYTSSPTDPTPVSRWVASAQGEDGRSTKGELTHLRGRAAVQEAAGKAGGIRRVRIYDVKLQVLRGTSWVTVAHQPNDRWNEASRAYVEQYTPNTVQKCWNDPALTSTYRVVNTHGVRRVDGVIANRTTYEQELSGADARQRPALQVDRAGGDGRRTRHDHAGREGDLHVYLHQPGAVRRTGQ